MVRRNPAQFFACGSCVDSTKEHTALPLPSLEVGAQNRLLVGVRDFRGDEVLTVRSEQEVSITRNAQITHPLRVTARATRYLVPSSVSRFTGVRRGSPVFRPLTSRMREPHTLIPRRVSPAISRLMTLRVNQPGARYRGARNSSYRATLYRRRWPVPSLALSRQRYELG